MSVQLRSSVSKPCGINHVAVVPADLDGFRAFYEDAIGLETAIVQGAGPGHGRVLVSFAGDVMLHVFETAGYDPTVHGVASLLTLRYYDPDGFEGDINCFNPRFDATAIRAQDEVIDLNWVERTKRALRADDQSDRHPSRERPA